jgi:hypothetical protein
MRESKYKVKIVCGFRKEQEYTINANEAHKAYYLFNHPEKRGTFSNGLAIRGADIQRIEPDYNATMGWNHTHQLTSDDWNEVNISGVARKFKGILHAAKEIAQTPDPTDFRVPLYDLVKEKYPALNPSVDYESVWQRMEKLSAEKKETTPKIVNP